MANRSDTEVLQVLSSKASERLSVDVVGRERLSILIEPKVL
jgi:hypothetical protein